MDFFWSHNTVGRESRKWQVDLILDGQMFKKVDDGIHVVYLLFDKACIGWLS
jgi:hypothetical protein